MSLLMEDVLLSGFVEKSVYLCTDDSPTPAEVGRRRQGSLGRRMSIASPSRSAATAAASGRRKSSDASRRMSDVGG